MKLPAGQRSSVAYLAGDVAALHAASDFEGALFQVASQFNTLEMIGPSVAPRTGWLATPRPHAGSGVRDRRRRRHHLPQLLRAVGGGIGQTHDRQIDCLADLGAELSSRLARPASEL